MVAQEVEKVLPEIVDRPLWFPRAMLLSVFEFMRDSLPIATLPEPSILFLRVLLKFEQ